MDPTIQARLDLVQKWATKYSLDPALVCAVIEQETGGTWDPYSTREEDEFFARYIAEPSGVISTTSPYRIAIPHDSIRSQATEARARAMSFGLMQVMGQTAREHGFSERYLTKLCDPDFGLDLGCKVLKSMIDKAGGNIGVGLQFYNGGSNGAYATQVLTRINKYKENGNS